MNLDQLLASLETSASIEKTASAAATVKPSISAELSGILEKKASVDLTKQAFAQGEELARELLSKFANEIQTANDTMVAEKEKGITSNEVAGGVNEVLTQTVNKAVAAGGQSDNQLINEKSAAEIAASTPTDKENEMNKTAAENLTVAQQIMQKLAQEFSPVVTTPAAEANVAGARVPNNIQVDNANMTAFADSTTQGVVPGGDGTVNALFETIVAKAVAQGGQSGDLVNGNNGGHVESRNTIGGDEVEKAAAVSALCEAGMDFDSAVDLVKQAEVEIVAEAWEQEKQACLGQLMDAGVDFDQAVDLVKQAEQDLFGTQDEDMAKEAGAAMDSLKRAGSFIADKAKSVGPALKRDASALPDQLSNVRSAVRDNKGVFNSGVGSAAKAVAKNKALQTGTAGVAAAGAGVGYAASPSREKKACIDKLMAEGVDFDTAVEMTKQASLEVYGE